MSSNGTMSETLVDRYSRPLTYNPHPLPTLPSINHLAYNMRRCLICRRLLDETETCAEHERRSSSGLTLAEYQLPRDPFNKYAPIQRQVPNGFPSPVMSAGSSSSDSEPLYTPNASRAASPINQRHGANVTSQQRRRSSKVATRRNSRRESLQLDNVTEQSKKIKKMEKEKAGRKEQALCLSRTEDSWRCYYDYERREQSGGNGNGAGLTANKINVLRGQEVVNEYFTHLHYKEALKRGPEALADHLRTVQGLLDAAPDETPFAHTFLAGTEEPCSHREAKSKECTTHGTADWRECRVVQSQTRFRENRARWMRANLSRAQLGQWNGSGLL